MNYLDQYIKALCLLYELRLETRKPDEQDWETRLRAYVAAQEAERKLNFRIINNAILPLAERLVSQRRKILGDPSRECHSTADDFLKAYMQLPFYEALPVAITIGNVSYKGRSVFGVTKDSVIDAIRVGNTRPHEPLKVHVWLTVQDMTVIDLTATSYLRSKGEPVAKSPANGILVWREERQSEFVFEPMLVWNKFCNHVEPQVSSCLNQTLFRSSGQKIGRNDPCPCNSGRKFKKCCGGP